MHPILRLAGFELSTYSVVYVVASMLTGMLWYLRLRRGRGDVDPTVQGRRQSFVIACALAGTHIISVIPSAFAFAQQERLVWAGRSNFVGTLLSGTVGGLIVARGDLARIARTADIAGAPVPLVLAIGRIGCWAAGCCYGRETDAASAQYLRKIEGVWAMRYSTQLWSGLVNLGILVTLLVLEQVFVRARARGAT